METVTNYDPNYDPLKETSEDQGSMLDMLEGEGLNLEIIDAGTSEVIVANAKLHIKDKNEDVNDPQNMITKSLKLTFSDTSGKTVDDYIMLEKYVDGKRQVVPNGKMRSFVNAIGEDIKAFRMQRDLETDRYPGLIGKSLFIEVAHETSPFDGSTQPKVKKYVTP